MPVDPALFAPYLPMYRHRGPPHRDFPWWYNEHYAVARMPNGHEYARWVRVDGMIGPLTAGDDAATEIVLADQRQPLPAPALMPTQVWVLTRAGVPPVVTVSIVAVSATHVAYVDIGRTGIGDHVAGGVITDRIVTWHNYDAVLVLGPTPWGRDCPWARVGRALRATS